MDAVVTFSELAQLVSEIGIWPFILIVLVLVAAFALFNGIKYLFMVPFKKRSSEEMKNAVAGIQEQLKAIGVAGELSQNRIDKINENINVIQKKMRNVMNETDVIRFISVKFGIESDFKTNLLNSIVGTFGQTNGQRDSNIKTKLNNEWTNLKNDLYSLEVPINLKHFINSHDDDFSEKGDLYKKIKKILDAEDLDTETKMARIEDDINSTLLKIRDDLSSQFKK